MVAIAIEPIKAAMTVAIIVGPIKAAEIAMAMGAIIGTTMGDISGARSAVPSDAPPTIEARAIQSSGDVNKPADV
jgi:hypothetical protein